MIGTFGKVILASVWGIDFSSLQLLSLNSCDLEFIINPGCLWAMFQCQR